LGPNNTLTDKAEVTDFSENYSTRGKREACFGERRPGKEQGFPPTLHEIQRVAHGK